MHSFHLELGPCSVLAVPFHFLTFTAVANKVFIERIHDMTALSANKPPANPKHKHELKPRHAIGATHVIGCHALRASSLKTGPLLLGQPPRRTRILSLAPSPTPVSFDSGAPVKSWDYEALLKQT